MAKQSAANETAPAPDGPWKVQKYTYGDGVEAFAVETPGRAAPKTFPTQEKAQAEADKRNREEAEK